MMLSIMVSAFTALNMLNDTKLDAQSAFGVYKIRRELRDHVNYFLVEEMKLAGKYAAIREDGAPDIRDGRVFFAGEPDEEKHRNAEEYARKRKELCEVDAGEIGEKVTIRVPADMRLAPAFFELLEPFAVVEIDGAAL